MLEEESGVGISGEIESAEESGVRIPGEFSEEFLYQSLEQIFVIFLGLFSKDLPSEIPKIIPKVIKVLIDGFP